jgi:hypothetical protein
VYICSKYGNMHSGIVAYQKDDIIAVILTKM